MISRTIFCSAQAVRDPLGPNRADARDLAKPTRLGTVAECVEMA